MAVVELLQFRISLKVVRALVGKLIEIAGESSGIFREGREIKLFPTARQISNADLTLLKTTGLRKSTLKEFARQVDEGQISLASTQDVADFEKKVQSIKGIGPWTAKYMALKILRDADAFPETDLILAPVVKKYSRPQLELLRPWRGYLAALIWRNI